MMETSMIRTTTSVSRIAIRDKGWKRATTIATNKYNVISQAIMSSLPTSPIAFSELVKRVGAKVVSSDGSVPWYTISCLRELEVQGRVLKHQKPVGYSREAAPKGSNEDTLGQAAEKESRSPNMTQVTKSQLPVGYASR